jgi:phosphoribosyl-ATP pyrophosphohydrolase
MNCTFVNVWPHDDRFCRARQKANARRRAASVRVKSRQAATFARPTTKGLAPMSDVLSDLARLIHSRRAASGDTSYTRQLLDAGPEKCAKKFGEEAVETVIAAVSGPDAAFKAEAADTFYHLLVLLEARHVPLADVLAVLKGRMGTSGLDEKAQRVGPT